MKDQVTSIEQSKLPIEVHNKLIPFKGFSWVTWLVFAFTRKTRGWHMDGATRRHEGIHCAQQIELAEQAAEERMRAKAIEAYCQDCGCRVENECGIDSDSCIAFRTFIQKLSEK